MAHDDDDDDDDDGWYMACGSEVAPGRAPCQGQLQAEAWQLVSMLGCCSSRVNCTQTLRGSCWQGSYCWAASSGQGKLAKETCCH